MIVIYPHIKRIQFFYLIYEAFTFIQSVFPVECKIVEKMFHDILLAPKALLFMGVR